MRVLHVTPSYIPAYRYGGPVKAVHELCRALARKGIDVTVFTTDVDQGGRLGVPLNQAIEMEGVKVFYYPVKLMWSYCYSKKLSEAIKKHLYETDIVHIHSVYLYPTLAAARWCRKHKTPYLINPFGALDPAMIKLKGRVKKTLYIKFIERHNINNARAIHVCSDYEKENVLSLNFDVPVITVPRGIEPQEYRKPDNPVDLRKKYPDLRGKRIVLFLGRIHRKKGLDLLACAFRRIIKDRDDVRLVIAGSGEDRYVNKVKKIFRKGNINGKTIFTGMLLGPQKLSAFYSSDIFVLPSYGENFGIAALEAMACGVPVVTTNRVGLSADIDECRAGIVTDCDSKKIADAISSLLVDNKLRETMGENGRKLAENRFTWNDIADKMIGVYRAYERKYV